MWCFAGYSEGQLTRTTLSSSLSPKAGASGTPCRAASTFGPLNALLVTKSTEEKATNDWAKWKVDHRHSPTCRKENQRDGQFCAWLTRDKISCHSAVQVLAYIVEKLQGDIGIQVLLMSKVKEWYDWPECSTNLEHHHPKDSFSSSAKFMMWNGWHSVNLDVTHFWLSTFSVGRGNTESLMKSSLSFHKQSKWNYFRSSAVVDSRESKI